MCTFRTNESVQNPEGGNGAILECMSICDNICCQHHHSKGASMAECVITGSKPTDEDIRTILENSKAIAVVGVSHKEERASNKVARYIKENGYKMIPVNPKYKEVLGEKCYPDLVSVPEHVDMVDIFRGIDAIPAIVDEAIAIKAGAVWMQLELVHEESAEKARCAGLRVVMDKCVKIEHSRLLREKQGQD